MINAIKLTCYLSVCVGISLNKQANSRFDFRISVNQSGFTLIELFVGLGLIAILASLAAPSFTETIKKNRLINKANELVVALGVARQVAISRSLVTFVCHSNNTETTSPTCDGGVTSDWNTGYIIYTPPTRTIITSDRDFSSGTDTIIQQAKLNDDDGIVIQDINNNVGKYISFSSSGFLFDNTAIRLKVCDDRTGEDGKFINISAVGRVSIEDATGADACS